jgi:DNA transformation protein
MGEKGKNQGQESALTAELLIEKLSQIVGLSSKKMFGGHGIFHGGKMFALVDPQGQGYLKTDDSNRTDFESFGSHKHKPMPYYSIPDEIFNDPEKLAEWAKKSIDISK